MLKRTIIAALITVLLIGSAVYLFREVIVENILSFLVRYKAPSYIRIDELRVDLTARLLTLRGIQVTTPPGSPINFTATIAQATCRYGFAGRSPFSIEPTVLSAESVRGRASGIAADLTVARIDIDLKAKRAEITGLSVANHPDFLYDELFTATKVSFDYVPNGEAFSIGDLLIEQPVLCIERLDDRRVNILEIRKAFGALMPVAPGKEKSGRARGAASSAPSSAKTDPLIAPSAISLKNGKVFLIDRIFVGHPLFFSLEGIGASVRTVTDPAHAVITAVESAGEGLVDGGGKFSWRSVFDPKTASLTMSNRIEFSDIDIIPLQPYYTKYSPFLFTRGTSSGTLIVDFDNGNIGSMDELRFKGLDFVVKEGQQDAAFLETSVRDLAQYFTSRDVVIFDFKVKGDPAKPDFHLGPVSKKALSALAVSKASGAISGIIAEVTKAADQTKAGDIPSQPNEVEKIEGYYKTLKGLVDKYKKD